MNNDINHLCDEPVICLHCIILNDLEEGNYNLSKIKAVWKEFSE